MNEALRDHVTSAAFVLSLGKTHVAALVRLDLELAAEVCLDYASVRGTPNGALHRQDVTALNGLITRGLVTHRFDEAYGAGGPKHAEYIAKISEGTWPRNINWAITRAGRLVCELLQECGLYQEHAGLLLPLIEAKRERRRAS